MQEEFEVNKASIKASSFSISSILSDDLTGKKNTTPLKRKCGELKRIAIGRHGVAQLTQPDSNHSQVTVTLENRGLWELFYDVGTEMVITKSGRRMFPALKFTVSGLDASLRYSIMMDTVPADSYRYKYHESEWLVTGKAYPDVPRSKRIHVHSESPANGAKWMSSVISFHKVKITNNSSDCKSGHIVLNSLHKYQPRIHIVQAPSLDCITEKDAMTFLFPETSFMAVTAYQSEQITQLKIDNNPFAKGFRDPSPSDLERARLMNAMHYGMLGGDISFGPNLASLHMPSGICPRKQCVLPQSDAWMVQQPLLPSLPPPPQYTAQINPKEAPSPKRAKLSSDRNCSPSCPCSFKQQYPGKQDQNPSFNRTESIFQIHGPSVSKPDCACSNPFNPAIAHHYEHLRRGNRAAEPGPIRLNIMNVGHSDHNGPVPERSICACCVRTDLRQEHWSNELRFKNIKPPIFNVAPF